MPDNRIQKGVRRGPGFEIQVDGAKTTAHEGETVAAAVMAKGKADLRRTAKKHEPRGVYCGIGLCHECLVTINGIPNRRACQTLATPGCTVETQNGPAFIAMDPGQNPRPPENKEK